MTAPFTIAHRGGNEPELVDEAVAAGVDVIEVDIRFDRGRLVTRHDPRFPFLPVYYDRWHVRLRLKRQVVLAEMLDRLAGRASLLVDLKSTSVQALRLLLESLRTHDAITGSRISSSFWGMLRRAHDLEPRIKMLYSIGKRRELARFWELQERTHEATGVSIKERLLDKALTERFLAEGVEIAAYNVHSLRRARELASWGVAAIISGDLSLLQALRETPAG